MIMDKEAIINDSNRMVADIFHELLQIASVLLQLTKIVQPRPVAWSFSDKRFSFTGGEVKKQSARDKVAGIIFRSSQKIPAQGNCCFVYLDAMKLQVFHEKTVANLTKFNHVALATDRGP